MRPQAEFDAMKREFADRAVLHVLELEHALRGLLVATAEPEIPAHAIADARDALARYDIWHKEVGDWIGRSV